LKAQGCFQTTFFITARCTPKIDTNTNANPASDFASIPCPKNSQPKTNAETGLSNPSDETAAGESLAIPLKNNT